MKYSTTLLVALSAFTSTSTFAQNRIGTGKVAELYKVNCSSCHGLELEGGLGSSLSDGIWNTIDGTDAAIAHSIAAGNETVGMPAFGEMLSEQEIRSLVIFVHEQTQISDRKATPPKPFNETISTEDYEISIETVASTKGTLWSLDFLPNGNILTTEKGGDLWLIKNGKFVGPIKGTPSVKSKGQGGLLDIQIDPNYKTNGWVYLSFSEQDKSENAMTGIVRGKIKGQKWVDQETIYSADNSFFTSRAHHYGSRIIIEDDYLFFSVGDRGEQNKAQSLEFPNGKIHRIHTNGEVPTDNPFIDNANALNTIWSYGSRNAQGLAKHPSTGDLWESEHGPRGGDEINRIENAKNYGWPVITYGMNYNGSPITDITEKEGMEQPKHFWTPSIAVCGIDFYNGELFPQWKDNLFAGGLASGELHRLVIKNDEIVSDEIIFKTDDRVRDVINGPDGSLYVIINRKSDNTSTIHRLVPAN